MLVEEDACHIKSEAILRIGRKLRQPFPVGAAPLFVLPSFLRDGFYDQVCIQATAKERDCGYSMLSLPTPSLSFQARATNNMVLILWASRCSSLFCVVQIAGSRYNVFGKQDVCQLQHDQHADRFLQ